MKNGDYWRGRFAILEDAAQHQADQCVASLEDMYREAERTVQADLERWYGRFATNNGISLTEARKMLTTGQLEEFRWTVDQYIKAAQQANLSPEWIKKLENASARFHVSRLETIQLQIQQQMELLYGNQTDSIDELLKKVVSNGYTRGCYELQRGIGLGWDVTALNQQRLETLLSKPWTADNKTFRDRCWEGKANLVSGIQTRLTQALLRGDSLQKTTDAIRKQFGVARYKAGRLVHTETTYFNAVASRETYKEIGVEKVEIIETLDSHTCEICQPLDGKVIPMTQYEPGVTVPPFHPNCRGTTAPAIDPAIVGERAARNEDGTPTYNVPSNMKYTDWAKAFYGGGSKAGLTTSLTPDELKNLRSEARKKQGALNDANREISQLQREKHLAELSGWDERVKEYEALEADWIKKRDQLQIDLDNIYSRANIRSETEKRLFTSTIDCLPVQKNGTSLDDLEIIQKIAGGDQTSGSCASVALAYAGQKQGYEVLDFRGGDSRDFFSSKINKINMFKDLGVTSITADTAKTSLTNGKAILAKLEEGTEYYLSVGRHAAIVRNNGGVLQYLELQSRNRNGWTDFGDVGETLKYRFGCSSSSKYYSSAYATDISQLTGDDFENILGYINTGAGNQRKGALGGVK